MPFRGIAVSQADSPLVDGLADMLATNLAESQGVRRAGAHADQGRNGRLEG